MKCAKIRKLLSPFLDGELDKKRHDMVSQHLDRCADCSKELDTMQMVSVTMRNIQRIKTPPRYEDVIFARIRLGDDGKQVKSSWNPFLLPQPMKLALGAAASFMLVFIVVSSVKDFTSKMGTEPTMSSGENISSTIAEVNPGHSQPVLPKSGDHENHYRFFRVGPSFVSNLQSDFDGIGDNSPFYGVSQQQFASLSEEEEKFLGRNIQFLCPTCYKHIDSLDTVSRDKKVDRKFGDSTRGMMYFTSGH